MIVSVRWPLGAAGAELLLLGLGQTLAGVRADQQEGGAGLVGGPVSARPSSTRSILAPGVDRHGDQPDQQRRDDDGQDRRRSGGRDASRLAASAGPPPGPAGPPGGGGPPGPRGRARAGLPEAVRCTGRHLARRRVPALLPGRLRAAVARAGGAATGEGRRKAAPGSARAPTGDDRRDRTTSRGRRRGSMPCLRGYPRRSRRPRRGAPERPTCGAHTDGSSSPTLFPDRRKAPRVRLRSGRADVSPAPAVAAHLSAAQRAGQAPSGAEPSSA